jgi:hypothetical protein
LVEIGQRIEATHHNINTVRGILNALLNRPELYEIVEKPSHVYVINKSTRLPALHITVAR